MDRVNGYYRPQGKVMFSKASVSHSVHEKRAQGVYLRRVCLQWRVYLTPPQYYLQGSRRFPMILTSSGIKCLGLLCSLLEWNVFSFSFVYWLITFLLSIHVLVSLIFDRSSFVTQTDKSFYFWYLWLLNLPFVRIMGPCFDSFLMIDDWY